MSKGVGEKTACGSDGEGQKERGQVSLGVPCRETRVLETCRAAILRPSLSALIREKNNHCCDAAEVG